jgi:hypothetical protein
MSDIETEIENPAALLQSFDSAVKSRLQKPDNTAPDIHPTLRAHFVAAVGRAVDTVEMSQKDICEQFALLAVEGFDRDHITVPKHVKINTPRGEPTPLYTFDRLAPHRVPAVIHPAEDLEDMPLGVYIR